jgi:glutamyl-tRNA reductase
VDSSLVIIGLSSRTATPEMRQRFWIDEIAREEAAARLVRSEGISEAVVLVTPARTEFIVWVEDASEAANSVLRLLAQRFGLKLEEWKHFYRVTDTAAIRHVFALAAGTEREPDESTAEIASDMKASVEQAQKNGTVGRMLDALFIRAFAIAESQHVMQADTDAIAEEAKTFHKQLVAERIIPATAVLRVRIEEICRHELDTLESVLGALDPSQKQVLTEMRVRVTKRIAAEVAQEFKGLEERAATQDMADAAQRLINHGHVRDIVYRSQN